MRSVVTRRVPSCEWWRGLLCRLAGLVLSLVGGGVLFAAQVGSPVPAGGALGQAAETWVRLMLALGEHDANYVDAYYGPPAWREEVKRNQLSLGEIRTLAQAAQTRVAGIDRAKLNVLEQARLRYLEGQYGAMIARVDQLGGRAFTFDQESMALYGAVAPKVSDQEAKAILARIDRLVPGDGTLAERYARYRERFVVPRAKLEPVFAAAVQEARLRTQQHLRLPKEENFRMEFVTNQVWGAYNWYKGGYQSLIQVNLDVPITIDRVLLLMSHEGYPGHHVQNVLLERDLYRKRGWVEFSALALYSQQSLVAEGVAEYGVELAFPPTERLAFEQKVLYPLAGLDPALAAPYHEIRQLMERLGEAGTDAARRYLDGNMTRPAYTEWLTNVGLLLPESAATRVKFAAQNRSYVINYTVGRGLVAGWMDRHAGIDPKRRWREFGRLLASPVAVGDLSR